VEQVAVEVQQKTLTHQVGLHLQLQLVAVEGDILSTDLFQTLEEHHLFQEEDLQVMVVPGTMIMDHTQQVEVEAVELQLQQAEACQEHFRQDKQAVH
jgi:hypothetical protein